MKSHNTTQLCSRLTGYCFNEEQRKIEETRKQANGQQNPQETCVDDLETDCIKYCSDDNTCDKGEYCHYDEILDIGTCLKTCPVDGMCQLKCTSNSECEDGYICHSDGSCQYPCGNDLDCYESEYCDKAEEICVPRW